MDRCLEYPRFTEMKTVFQIGRIPSSQQTEFNRKWKTTTLKTMREDPIDTVLSSGLSKTEGDSLDRQQASFGTLSRLSYSSP